MGSGTRAGARSGQANRRAGEKRKHRGAGAAITSVLLVAIVGLVVLVLANQPHYRVTPTVTTDLVKAMSSVPATDVIGQDPVGRPPGTVRSYFQVRGRVTTIMYVSHQPLQDEKDAAVRQLAGAGWKAPGNLPPGRVATEQDSFTGIYANNNNILQVAFVRIRDITAATYIIQSVT